MGREKMALSTFN